MIMIRVRTCRDVVVTIWADSVQRVRSKHPDVNAMLINVSCLLELQFGRKNIQCERITMNAVGPIRSGIPDLVRIRTKVP